MCGSASAHSTIRLCGPRVTYPAAVQSCQGGENVRIPLDVLRSHAETYTTGGRSLHEYNNGRDVYRNSIRFKAGMLMLLRNLREK